MRLLFLIQDYPPDKLGGHQLRCKRTVDGLRERGHETLVVTGRSVHAEGLHTSRTPGVARVLDTELNSGDQGPLWWTAAVRRNTGKFKALYEQFQPDVVCVWSIRKASLAFLSNVLEMVEVPVAHFIGGHSAFWTDADPWYSFWDQGKYNRSVSRALQALLALPFSFALEPYPARHRTLEKVCFNSKFLRDWYVASGLEFQEAAVIPGGVDLTQFQNTGRHAHQGPLRLLISSRFTKEKGFEQSIQAVSHVVAMGSNVTLSIVGQDMTDYSEILKSRIGSMGLERNVQIIGEVAYSEMPAIYASHDVLLHLSRIESWSNSILEAMASGMVVIASDRGGTRELIMNGENGFLVPYSGGAPLIEKIQAMVADPGLRQEVGEKARHTIEGHYSMQAYLNQVEAFLMRVN